MNEQVEDNPSKEGSINTDLENTESDNAEAVVQDAANEEMVKFKSIGKSYVEPDGRVRRALWSISFTLNKGDFAFLTGHSGAGKSTLLKLLTLSEQPTAGELLVDGKVVCSQEDSKRNRRPMTKAGVQRYRRHLGTVFQDHQLLMDRSVYENVVVPLDIIGDMGTMDKARRVKAALEQVGLSGKERQTPATLSSGERQRVGIARAIVHKPKIIIADEPTGNLDPQLSLEIMQLFKRFSDVGVTVLVATHDMESVSDLTLSAKILRLQRGALIG